MNNQYDSIQQELAGVLGRMDRLKAFQRGYGNADIHQDWNFTTIFMSLIYFGFSCSKNLLALYWFRFMLFFLYYACLDVHV